MHMITEWRPPFHPPYSHRILYVGHDLALLEFLRAEVADCQIIRCPTGSLARLFIQHINYSLFLFDERLPDTAGLELAEFARCVAGRQETPFIIRKRSDKRRLLAFFIRRLLSG